MQTQGQIGHFTNNGQMFIQNPDGSHTNIWGHNNLFMDDHISAVNWFANDFMAYPERTAVHWGNVAVIERGAPGAKTGAVLVNTGLGEDRTPNGWYTHLVDGLYICDISGRELTVTNGGLHGPAIWNRNVTVLRLFVPVIDIIDVPEYGIVGEDLPLTGEDISIVVPSNATNQEIVWAVVDGTGTLLASDVTLTVTTDGITLISVTEPGLVRVRATIEDGLRPGQDFVKYFYIVFTEEPEAPVIVDDPEDVTITEGESATFTVVATGAATLTFQWYELISGTWTEMSGEAADELVISNAALTDDGRQFRVVVTNAQGDATSNAATLTVTELTPVNAAPIIITPPASITVNEGNNATFTVVATGIPSPTYQWETLIDGVWEQISGATSQSLTISSTTLAMSGDQFRVVVSNSEGSITSAAATLTVNPVRTPCDECNEYPCECPIIILVTVAFNLAGGMANNVAPIQVPAGTSLLANSVSLPTPTRSGFTFQGWFLPNNAPFMVSTIITENVTVTAAWQAIQPTQPSQPVTPITPTPAPTTPTPSTPEPSITIPVNDDVMRVEVIAVDDNHVIVVLPNNRTNEVINTNVYGTAIFDITGLDNIGVVSIPRAALVRFANAGLYVELRLNAGRVTFDQDAMLSITNGLRNTHITIAFTPQSHADLSEVRQEALRYGHNAYLLSIYGGSNSISEVGGVITITTPYNGLLPVAVWLLCENGQLHLLDSVFCPEYGVITFTTSVQGVFVIGEAPARHIMRLAIGNTIYSLLYADTHIERQSDVAPFINPVYSRTMIPLRIVAEGLGAEVWFVNETRTVYISHDGQLLTLTIDVPLPDGMGVPVLLYDRTFVPLRYVSEFLDVRVRWDQDYYAVYVYQY